MNRFVYLRFRDCFAAFMFVNQRFKYDGTDDTLRTDSLDKNKLTDFLGDSELKSIMSDGYNAYVFIGNELKSAQFKVYIRFACLMQTTSSLKPVIKAVNR